MSDMKEEDIDLSPWGYAPGGYSSHCIDCPSDLPWQARPTAEKRAWRCRDHALAAMARDFAKRFDGEAPMTDTAKPDFAAATALIAKDHDHLANAQGEQAEWLVEQLLRWPERVHPDRTTNDRFTRYSMAASFIAREAEIAELTEALKEADRKNDAMLHEWNECESRLGEEKAISRAVGEQLDYTNSQIDRLTRALEVNRLACRKAALTFRGYAALHAAKGTDEADAKRAVNEVLAEEMEAALSQIDTIMGER